MTVLVHKAVEPDKLSRAGKQRYSELVAALIANGSGTLVQPKYDGVYAQFIFTEAGRWQAYSRTGQELLSVGPAILDRFEAKALPERRYAGELWLPSENHSTINGRARKQSPQHLELKLFDSFLPDGQEPYMERYDFVFEADLIERVPNLPVHGSVFVVDDLYDMADKLRKRGSSAYDGLIMRDAYGLYVPGKGTDGEIIKIKPRAEGDFRVVGTTPGLGNRAGGYGALVVDLGSGVTTEVGTGLTAKDVMEEASPVGRIATIEYLGVTKDGKLREPSFKGYRFDKTEADVLDHTQQTED